MDQAEDDHADRAADDTAVDREPALPYRLETEPVCQRLHVRIERAIIYARADDAQRQDTDQKIEQPVGGDIAMLEHDAAEYACNDDAGYDNNGVVIDGKSADRYPRIEQRKIHSASLQSPPRILAESGSGGALPAFLYCIRNYYIIFEQKGKGFSASPRVKFWRALFTRRSLRLYPPHCEKNSKEADPPKQKIRSACVQFTLQPRLMRSAPSTRRIVFSGSSPMRSFSRRLSSVRICSSKITESFASP